MEGENTQISAVVLFINYYRHLVEINREITECIKICFDMMIFLFLSKNILLFKAEHLVFILKRCFSS